MIADLQVAKQQTWEEKERLSEMYKEERRKNMASKACDMQYLWPTSSLDQLVGLLLQGILDLVMDTLKKEQHEACERLKVLYREKDQLAVSYKERKKKVDDLKEQLQMKIGEYSKLSENDAKILLLTTCNHT